MPGARPVVLIRILNYRESVWESVMRKNSFLYYSLLAMLLPSATFAGIRVGNHSRSNAQGYQQVNELRYGSVANNQVAPNPIPAEMPIPVSNQDIANSIQTGDANAAANMAKLENCSMIYPEGEFAWTRPTVGRGTGGAATCTAVIEMRAIGMGPNGSDAILARANLAAGDAVNCNISDFPEATYLPAAGEIEFPADHEPTVDDVIKVMNQEQKQNAGIKIAASAIIGGLGGNMAGKNEPGHDGLLGGGKAKTNSTIVGALGGAALMAGSLYTGKVAGDTILSAGVNAAAGAVVGNIVASGDSVMRIEACTVDDVHYKCLWGYYEEYDDLKDAQSYVSATNPNDFKVCRNQTSDPETKTVCEYANLNTTNATIDGCNLEQKNRSNGAKKDLQTLFSENHGSFDCANANVKYCYKNNQMEGSATTDCDDVWIKLSGTVKKVSKRTPAMVVNVRDKGFGWKKSDWSDFVAEHGSSKVVGRTGNGVAQNLPNANGDVYLHAVSSNFTPVYQDSEDGGIIDLNNKARMKGTLTGAGVGGGMGAFVGYQGAQKDIEDRWVTAVREYKDSLQKIYCATGNRFLSHYNDMVIIPEMHE